MLRANEGHATRTSGLQFLLHRSHSLTPAALSYYSEQYAHAKTCQAIVHAAILFTPVERSARTMKEYLPAPARMRLLREEQITDPIHREASILISVKAVRGRLLSAFLAFLSAAIADS